MMTGRFSPSGFVRMSCHDRPYLSWTQPYPSLNGYLSSGINTFPPADSFPHMLSIRALASLSCDGSKLTMKDIDGLNLNRGPALIAMKANPQRLNDTISQSPDGVLWIVVTFVIFEAGKAEV